MLRGAAGAIVIALVGVTTMASASAIRGRFSKTDESAAVTFVSHKTPAENAKRQEAVAPKPVVSKPVAEQSGAPIAPFAPVIAAGQTMLRDSVMALRTDTNVTVSFDLTMIRTRRPEKFEAFLRSTLVQIYGAHADLALAKIPEGGIARQGDLLNELPIKGIHIPASNAWTFDVYPETRPGQDGPLVIRYRVSLNAASAQR